MHKVLSWGMGEQSPEVMNKEEKLMILTAEGGLCRMHAGSSLQEGVPALWPVTLQNSRWV
ncbi:hypothetical protein POL68_03790 [Stigmatella sp. ncwal1]|uniref:Uncharacterized protein n=1 Tax=Stigmatella ashevillensis TaxID=2995309 RepID=A0ABT5D421_9BACT|nr:hypothetical protein [Stigmatella ashevillena]MDC0707583.1 hypothetical protein [Stigmatella ashevillena]